LLYETPASEEQDSKPKCVKEVETYEAYDAGLPLKLYYPKLNLKWYTVIRWREVDPRSICVHMTEHRKAVVTAE